MRFSKATLLSLPLLVAANESFSTESAVMAIQTSSPSSHPAQVAYAALSIETSPSDSSLSSVQQQKQADSKSREEADREVEKTAESPSSTTQPLPTDGPVIDDELRKRQAPGQIVGAGVPGLPEPTQMSPVTTYMVYVAGGAQSPVVYTQTFPPFPETWALPQSGSIGLGTISGQIGVVKTKTKRNYIALATDVLKRGVGHDFDKRKHHGHVIKHRSAANAGVVVSRSLSVVAVGGTILWALALIQ